MSFFIGIFGSQDSGSQKSGSQKSSNPLSNGSSLESATRSELPDWLSPSRELDAAGSGPTAGARRYVCHSLRAALRCLPGLVALAIFSCDPAAQAAEFGHARGDSLFSPAAPLLPVAVTSAALASSLREERSLAPDGRPGFGAEVDESSLLRLMRTPDEADQAFLRELKGLAEDVGILVSITEGFYRERRYFNLLGSPERGDLEQLLSSYQAYSLDPSAAMNQGQAVSMAFARMHLDTRFRTRIEILREWGYEASQLRSGLRVLEGAASSFVVLGDVQARSIARRIDLAAARLRNIRLDLEALRESMESARSGGPDPNQVRAFLALFEIGDRDKRMEAIEADRLRGQSEEMRMTAVLFTTKLKSDAARELDWRSSSNAEARDLLEEAREALPESGDDVASELRRMGKTKRRKFAREKSIAGLELDPLNEELAWIAGSTSKLVFGEYESASHYDRFLILRGIRHDREATFRERELTDREREALRFLDELERLVDPNNPNRR